MTGSPSSVVLGRQILRVSRPRRQWYCDLHTGDFARRASCSSAHVQSAARVAVYASGLRLLQAQRRECRTIAQFMYQTPLLYIQGRVIKIDAIEFFKLYHNNLY